MVMEFNIQRQGRKWSRTEIEHKYHELCPEKIELIEGKMFWTDEQRLNMLATKWCALPRWATKPMCVSWR